MAGFETEPLSTYLRERNKTLYGRALELRQTAAAWLAYVPQTFPHYTQHTIEHSEEIIHQISALLFNAASPTRPVLDLSAVECYILIASAFLHDAGMVVSDQEKASILTSDEWRSWTTGDGPAAQRWTAIQAIRTSLALPDEATASFLADVQTRHLIAEHVRKHHHLRSAHLLSEHSQALAGFSFDDAILLRTIADICTSHGLQDWELADDSRFPSRRDVLGEQANVRLLAILLRLGDLLDMRSDRACPLLLNASSPLPADSLAHWTRYQRLTHRLTAPDTIQLEAECQTADEHRYIHDWCRWIVAEVSNARDLAPTFTRHTDWNPPKAELRGPSATLIVRPSPQATYVPVDWAFRTDDEQIVSRLIHDLHTDRFSFLRELVQNALDATRCKMYHDLASSGRPTPASPTGVPNDVRDSYPIRIRLEQTPLLNPLSGEEETRQLLIVEDAGIGMDTHVITDYFLQIGRSFYRTEEFRRRYPFSPTSRFGLGFLSVFAVSDNVTVETWDPSSPTNDPPILLSLTGPRTYILAEKSHKPSTGTCVKLLLHESIPQGSLTSFLGELCPMVEFPIVVEDLGVKTTIRAEDPSQFLTETPDVTHEGAYFTTRTFPINRPGIEGFIYVFSHITAHGESWADWWWAHFSYPDSHPSASPPHFPTPLFCLHGIALTRAYRPTSYPGGGISPRLDFRHPSFLPDLSRGGIASEYPGGPPYQASLDSRLQEIIDGHLAETPLARPPERWRYIQRLSGNIESPRYWSQCKESLRVFVHGQERFTSLDELLSSERFTVVLGTPPEGGNLQPPYDNDLMNFLSSDFSRVSDFFQVAIFDARHPSNVRRISKGHLAVDWATSPESHPPLLNRKGIPFYVVPLPAPSKAGISIHQTTHRVFHAILLDQSHPFVTWLANAYDACHEEQYGLNPAQIDRVIDLVSDAIVYRLHTDILAGYLAAWRTIPGLPSPLLPPESPFAG